MHHAVSGVQSVRGSALCSQGCFTCRKYLTTAVCIYTRIHPFPDSYTETCAWLRRCCWAPPQQLSPCVDGGQGQNATTGISHSALYRTERKTLITLFQYPLWTYLVTHLDFFFLSLQTISLNSFPSWRTVTHCRQKASRCILIRQRRGLQLIDITVILFWSTFFFISTALHCSLRVHRRLVAFSPTQR